MSIVLNITILALCLLWLNKSKESSGKLVAIVFTFIGGSIISFLIALFIDNAYLDGLSHLLITGGSALLFWVIALFLIWGDKQGARTAFRIGHSAIVSIVLLVPLFIYLMISNMSFKIGG